MATLTKIKYTNQADHLPSRMRAVINYCLNPEKTKPEENGQTKSISSREYRSGVKRESWKFRLRASIKYAMERCGTQEEFILRMKNMGYGVRWERGRKNITYTCFKEPKYKNGAYRKCNDDKLSDEKYLKEVMEDEFRQRQEILAGRDDGYVQTKRGNVLDKPNLLSVPSRTGVLLAGTAGLISTMGTGNDGKTPEEREAEERARETSGNLAAAVALTAVGVSLALKKTHTEEESSENEHETESDNELEMKL